MQSGVSKRMRIAFIVVAHHRPEQTIRLVERLSVDGVSVLVHVDRNSTDDIYSLMLQGLSGIANVQFLPRYRCRWGDFGMVRATLTGLGALMEEREAFDYAVLLSGQDYPIKRRDELLTYLEANQGVSFLEHFPLPRPDWPGYGGVERFFHRKLRVLGHELRLPDIPRLRFLPRGCDLPGGLQLYQGGSWWLLHSTCVSYILRFVADNPNFVDAFSGVRSPDESFFQTILLNSHLRDRIVNNDLRYEDWSAGGSHPAILTTSHFPELKGAEGFFARKFDCTQDKRVLDLIDQELLGAV